MKRKFWYPFNPGDWGSDPNLKLCSRAARELWLQLIGHMHITSPEPGRLLLPNGSTPTPAQLFTLFGDVRESQEDFQRLLDEIVRSGVCNMSGEGVISCRRILREVEVSKRNSENASKRYRSAGRSEVADLSQCEPPCGGITIALDVNLTVKEDGVFATYLETLPPVGWVKHSKLTSGMRAKLRARLKAFSPEEMKQAFEEMRDHGSWMLRDGKRPGLDFFLRSDDRVRMVVEGQMRSFKSRDEITTKQSAAAFFGAQHDNH